MDNCIHLDLTSDDGEWDPMSVQRLEEGTSNISSIQVRFDDAIEAEYCHTDAVRGLLSNVFVSSLSHTTKLELSPEVLSENWSISIPDTKHTL